MENTINNLYNLLTTFGINVLGAILIFVIGKIVAGWAKNLVKKLSDKAKIDPTIGKFLSNFVYGMGLVFIIIMALGRIGIETSSVIAVLGAAGLAVGFALQNSLSNFAAGILLLLFRPIRVGDYIEAGGAAGTVDEIHIFTTKLKTPDNKVIFIPNGTIASGNIVNYSLEDTRRVDMTFGIGYSDDIQKAKDIILKILSSDDRILKDPAPVIALSELADSSVNFTVRPWVKKENYWGVYFDTLETVKNKFDAAGISIPFPQTDVHLFKEN